MSAAVPPGLDSVAPVFVASAGHAALLQSVAGAGGDAHAHAQDEQATLVQINAALEAVEEEQAAAHRVLKERYARRFPELASFDLDAAGYARVVLALSALGEEWGEGVGQCLETTPLPAAMRMIISVTAAVTKGVAGGAAWTGAWIVPCAELVVRMGAVRAALLGAVQERMGRVCPNVVALVGVEVAAQLVAATGGIRGLAGVPAGNIQVLGRGQRRNLAGLAASAGVLHAGFLAQSALVRGVADAALEVKAQRLLAAKTAMAARVDADAAYRDGSYGARLLQEIAGKLERLGAPAPAKQVKPLPVPDSARKKRRGGRRARRLKELYAQTELRRQKNRVAFGAEAEVEVVVGDRMEGMGLLGQRGGSGALRAPSTATERSSKLREYLKRQADSKYHTSAMVIKSTAASQSSSAAGAVSSTHSTPSTPSTPTTHGTHGTHGTHDTPSSSIYDRTAGFRKKA